MLHYFLTDYRFLYNATLSNLEHYLTRITFQILFYWQ